MAAQLSNILITKIHDRQLSSFANRFFSGRLIDIGCGPKPYRDMMRALVSEHIGVDHESTLHDKSQVDLIGSAYAIPALDESFDSALCTAVLEHLEEPEEAVKECFRVLRSGGVAIYSVPFIWHVHEAPRDFYRYTKFGLAYLFEKVGFEIIEIKALSGFWVTFGQLFVYNIYRFNKGPMRYIPVIPVIGILVQAISYIFDRLDKTEQWTWMYMLAVKKP